MLLSLALANEPKLELIETTTFGTFAGTDYVMHQGTVTFEDGEPLSVELVVPANLENGN